MTDFKRDINNKIFQDAVLSLHLRFPVAEISRDTKESKGNISNFLNDKKPVPDSFLQTFSEAFNIDLREFGYTKGLKRIEQKKPPPIDTNEGLKDKMIALLENALKRVEAELERALKENERLNQK